MRQLTHPRFLLVKTVLWLLLMVLYARNLSYLFFYLFRDISHYI